MKGVVRITKQFDFEMAHCLDDHQGKCKNIHGHSYQLFVTIKGTPRNIPNHPENGMLIDFKVLKDIVKSNVVNKLDHSLVLWEKSPFLESALKNTNLKIVNFHPTCENLTIEIANILKEKLPKDVSLFSVFLRETASSYAEWYATDNE